MSNEGAKHVMADSIPRALYLTWTDRKPFTRRARVYQAYEDMFWRVELTDPQHKVNVYVPGLEAAKALVKKFEAGESAWSLFNGYDPETS
jgi:hypothetical protein